MRSVVVSGVLACVALVTAGQSGGIAQKDIGEIVLILNGAAGERAPDSYRGTLKREAVGLREAANQAVVEVDSGARQNTPYLRQNVAEIEAAERDVEELHSRSRRSICWRDSGSARNSPALRPVSKIS